MKIGLIVPLHGAPGTSPPPPTWESISRSAAMAESVGFDSFVFEDALIYIGKESTEGCWESVSIAAALAATTSRIEFGQSVINSPYRSPAMTAKIAETLDEISGGRYIFGLGAGNTPDSDYEAFGFPTDKRFSRFAEAIEIIHGLLKTGTVDYQGSYHTAREAAMVLRGPRRGGPPIVIAAGGPKMLRLVARYADGWNWWIAQHDTAREALQPVIDELDRACNEVGRDPASLGRTLDVYTIDPLNLAAEEQPNTIGKPISGTSDEIAETLLDIAALGFQEIRCDVYPKTERGIEAMAPIVDRVHAG